MTGALNVLAVDLGATSVRVATVDLDASPPVPKVIHRWPNQPVRFPDGSLRWDWPRLMDEIRTGLRLGLEQGPVASIGIDSWGVDYGLLDGRGELLSAPYSYRDARTASWLSVVDRIGPQRLYGITGIQLLAVNTIFQLACHDRDELAAARQLLMLPDLVGFQLTGELAAERSIASTTALLDARTGEWSEELLDAVGVPPAVMPPIRSATERLGSWCGVPVHLTGGHDTASAVVAIPGEPGASAAFVSSGTWVLVGAERGQVDTSEAARARNFGNEAGALGGFRFLKNLAGFWLLEACREGWGNPSVTSLVSAAAEVTGPVPTCDALDDRFLAPHDMRAEICAAAGLPETASPALVTRCILESIAATTAAVVEDLAQLSGRHIDQLYVVGGGARIELLNRLYAKHCEVNVTVGSTEAAALGNALVQGISLGRYAGLSEARQALAEAA